MTDFLPAERYSGTLADAESIVDIQFTVGAGEDCHLTIEIDQLPLTEKVMTISRSSAIGTKVSHLKLRGRSLSGRKIESDHLSIMWYQFNTSFARLEVSAAASTVIWPLEEKVAPPTMRLLMRGFKSYPTPAIPTPLGTCSIHGDAHLTSINDVSGAITVTAPHGPLDQDWRTKAEQFLSHVHRGMALAHGGRLQTPLRELTINGEKRQTFYAGGGCAAEMPVHDALNHAPIEQALIDGFFRDGPLPENLWGALGWMHSASIFNEIRFLTGMTALEAIIESELPAKRGTTMPKERFKTVLRQLQEVLDRAELTPTEHTVLSKSIQGINRKTFRQKLEALFDHYRLPQADFGDKVLQSLVNLRNEVVHRGSFPPSTDPWQAIILVRELITRIMLSAIGFQGRYRCYIGGVHDRNFVLAIAPDYSNPVT
jgi:hypothetical protein